jgi:hypothetical protein
MGVLWGCNADYYGTETARDAILAALRVEGGEGR